MCFEKSVCNKLVSENLQVYNLHTSMEVYYLIPETLFSIRNESFAEPVGNVCVENLLNRIKVHFPYLTPTQGSHQREGMGLLEYQAMPSLHDEVHDGVLCPLRLGQMVWSVMAGGMDRP